MPQFQMIDTSPSPNREKTPLENTLSSFSQRYQKNTQEEKDYDALKGIYQEYQNADADNKKKLFEVSFRPGISPTARVAAASQLADEQKKIHELKLQGEKKIVEQEKKILETKEKELTRKRLENSGWNPEEIDTYESASVGGQTEIIKKVEERKQREKSPENLSSKLEDYDIGLTPKERVKRQDERFKIQTPIVQKNSDSVRALHSEGQSINLLQDLNSSGKVGEGVHNLNINPFNGELIIPKFATPEEQLFVKTVNDFTVKAKESFGARVSNFELDRFMQRLPTLANSKEGRALILRQMDIINQSAQLEKKALQEVFDEYGVRNIDFVEAERIARNRTKDRQKELDEEYLKYDQLAQKTEDEYISKIKEKTPEGMVPLRTPKGPIKYFKEKDLDILLDPEKGYRKI